MSVLRLKLLEFLRENGEFRDYLNENLAIDHQTHDRVPHDTTRTRTFPNQPVMRVYLDDFH